MKPALVFAHGWGSGPFIWDDMIPHFSDYDCTIINMGFLGEENLTVPDGKFIGIGHSLGGAWLLKHYPDQMVGFVSIASFNCFYKHIPKQILSAMQRNVVKDTTKQIAGFWRHAGLDYPGGIKNLKPAKLIEGLTWLGQWKCDIPSRLPVKVLASYDDHIVPENMTKDVWKDRNIEWVETGGHMLPLTRSQWCIEKTKEFLNEFE